MTKRRIFTALGFVAVLAAGGAYAQGTIPSSVGQSSDGATEVAMAPMNGATAPSDGAVGPSSNTLALVSQDQQPGQVQAVASEHRVLFTNGPIPDTRANRARYGQPLSHAGKRSAPAGN